MHRLMLVITILISLLFAPGFVCATRVERLEGEVDALRIQFEEIQQRTNNEQTQISEMVLRADEKLLELEELQRRANELLTRNSVDLGLQLESLKTELAGLRGQVELQQRKLVQIGQEVGAIVGTLGLTTSGKVIALPEGADELYRFGDAAYAEQRLDEAREAFAEFVIKYPDDTRVDEALYKLASSYQIAGMHTEAVSTARSLLERNSKSPNANGAIWVIGESAAALGDCNTAKVAFETLSAVSSHAKKAKARLKELKSTCP